MSKISTITAQVRDRVGKGAARAVRRAGRVPAVIYGNKQESLAISLEPRELHRHLHSAGFFTRLFDIAVGHDSHRVLARDVQLHPVSDRPLHVDFMRVGADATLHVQVPVHFVNQEKCPGLRIGGVLNIVRHEVELICNVNDIPEAIVIDLLPYQIGDSIHISMVTIPEGARPAIADRDFTIATIAPPTVAVDAATAA